MLGVATGVLPTERCSSSPNELPLFGAGANNKLMSVHVLNHVTLTERSIQSRTDVIVETHPASSRDERDLAMALRTDANVEGAFARKFGFVAEFRARQQIVVDSLVERRLEGVHASRRVGDHVTNEHELSDEHLRFGVDFG